MSVTQLDRSRGWETGEQRLRDDPTLHLTTGMAEAWAQHEKVCIRPLLRTVTDVETGDSTTIPIRCGSTRERVCTPCADAARRLRMQQCREGWHLTDEPEADPTPEAAPESYEPDDAQLDDDQADNNGDEDEATRRVRSTRRRTDADDLPRLPRSHRTVGRTWTGRDGQTYRPSMFITLTLPSYGRISPGTGCPVDPHSYDYRRAALDAIHLPKLLGRWVENLRRCAGYTVQYFAVVEPQRRLAPHVHLAVRGAIPRATVKAVTKATYVQVWWPSFDHVVYDQDTTGLPDWTGNAYADPDTGCPLPTWEEALDEVDAQLDADPSHQPAHVLRLGAQVDVKGLIAPSEDADRAVRYLTKYLTKSIADTYTDPSAAADEDHLHDPDDTRAAARATVTRARLAAHVERLHEEVRWLPCSPECANWLAYGTQPKDPVPGMTPGACEKRAHERDNLGYGGRRVQVSRRWSGKTLTEHRADRATVVRETLAAAGFEAEDLDRLGAHHTLPDGRPRFVWTDVPVTQSDYTAVIARQIATRRAWQTQYDTAKSVLERQGQTGSDPPVDDPFRRPPHTTDEREHPDG